MGSTNLRRMWPVVGVAAITAVANAGPVWCEAAEAGKTTTTAEVPFGAGPIGKIKGRLDGVLLANGVGPTSGDFVDVYRIYIRFPGLFTAKTVSPAMGSAFNTNLWLFDFQGHGLLANDNGAGISPFSEMGNASNDGTGIVIQHAGIYYIAVSGPDHAPVSLAGAIFDIMNPFEVSGPDGPGGAGTLADWMGRPLIGDYEINLTGVMFPPCPGDVNLDGVVNVDDLNIVLSNWNSPVPPNAQGDLTGDGLVDVTDLNEILANWASTECFDAQNDG